MDRPTIIEVGQIIQAESLMERMVFRSWLPIKPGKIIEELVLPATERAFS